MKTYIWKIQKGYYVNFGEEIDAEYWEGQIGTTYEDFLDNKWVLLSDEQVAFHEENPNASIYEVLTMELDPTHNLGPVEEAKKYKLESLNNYDNSSDINDFTVNGEMHAWFTPEQRSNYRNSIDAAKLLSIDNLSVFIGDTLVTIPTSSAEQMLAAIQLYADQCFIVTRQHKTAIETLNTVEDVNNYDFTVGYPSKLNFILS